ncbi:MAG TPA: zinc-ribbon domain-containing protein, partial [Chloroflexota bacterium]
VPDLETTLERWSFGERVCPHCGQKNATDDVYCQRCAARLTEDVICAVCHSTAPCGARYCPSCGAKL